jgi:hypothetical protein
MRENIRMAVFKVSCQTHGTRADIKTENVLRISQMATATVAISIRSSIFV